MSEIFIGGVWRLDWLGNPNRTAAFIATIMIAVWIIAYVRKWGFWAALGIFTGLGILLFHTMSRGGLIALGLGIIPLLLYAPRPWPSHRIAAVIISLWIILGTSVYLKTTQRISDVNPLQDRSITSRFEIWKVTPSMMVDAPAGWGLGNAANAYSQWYQPLNKGENYLNLLNSHLTWMVEFGWPLRFLYILGWAIVIFVCWPSVYMRWRSVAIGVWVCFFTAASFSSVADTFIPWLVPCIFLFVVTVHRLAWRQFPRLMFLCIPFGFALLTILGFWLLGNATSTVDCKANSVTFRDADPNVWILYDPVVMGTLYGKALRRVPNSNLLGLLFSLDQSPDLKNKTLVIGGSISDGQSPALKKAVHECARLVLLSPRFFPEEIGVAKNSCSKVKVYFGSFSKSPSQNAWQSIATCEVLPGVGDYIPRWSDLTFNSQPIHGNL